MNEVTRTSKDQLYYLQVRGFAGNSLLWWRNGRCGYTADVQDAHVFTKEEAFRQQRCRPDEDFPWRKDYIDSILQSHVHCEHVDRDAEGAFVATHEPSARQLAAEQADDAGLWFQAQTAAEGYLQQELRKLHAAIEGKTVEFKRPSPPPPAGPFTVEKFGSLAAAITAERDWLRTQVPPPADDEAIRLLHVVRAWHWTAAVAHDPGRLDPLYPDNAKSTSPLFAAINDLLRDRPYSRLTKRAQLCVEEKVDE